MGNDVIFRPWAIMLFLANTIAGLAKVFLETDVPRPRAFARRRQRTVGPTGSSLPSY